MHATLRTEPREQDDVIRARLEQSIGVVRAEAERIKAARDSIAPLEKRFNPEAKKLWNQLDDWLSALDALITDAPVTKNVDTAS